MYTDVCFGPQVMHVCHFVPMQYSEDGWNPDAAACAAWMASQGPWPPACADSSAGLVQACAGLVGEMVVGASGGPGGGGAYFGAADDAWADDGLGREKRRCRRGRRRGAKAQAALDKEEPAEPAPPPTSEFGSNELPFMLDSLEAFPPLGQKPPAAAPAPAPRDAAVLKEEVVAAAAHGSILAGVLAAALKAKSGSQWPRPGPDPDVAGKEPEAKPCDGPQPEEEGSQEDPLALALSREGCREIQRRLDEAAGPARDRLLSLLIPHAVELYESPHGNHVLTKAIEIMPSPALDPIIAQIEDKGCLTVAKHRFGCRVLERLIEHGTGRRIARVVEQYVAKAEELSRHDYGNFVVQHLLEHGDDKCRDGILEQLLPQVPLLAMHRKASHVVQCALQHCSLVGQRRIVSELFRAESPHSFEEMSDSRYGSYVAEELLSALRYPDMHDLLQEALRRLRAALPERRASMYFPRVAERFGLLEPGTAAAMISAAAAAAGAPAAAGAAASDV